MPKYNIYIIAKDEIIFEKKKKILKQTSGKKIDLIIWVPAVYIKLSQANKRVLKDLNTRHNTGKKKILSTLGCIAAHRNALLQIWTHKTNNNIVLEQDFKFNNPLPPPPKKTCYLGGWIIPRRISDAGIKQVKINPSNGMNKINYEEFSIIMAHSVFYKTYTDAYSIFTQTITDKIKNWDIFLKNTKIIKYFNYPETFIQNDQEISEIQHKKNKYDKRSINYGLPYKKFRMKGGGKNTDKISKNMYHRVRKTTGKVKKKSNKLKNIHNRLQIYNLLIK